MSSNYSVLCTSHNPAIEARVELRTPTDAEAAIAAGIEGHQTCDLVIARYSGALCELACPPTLSARRRDQHRCYPHRDSQWIGAEWLSLLHLAQQEPPGSALRNAAGDHGFHCWPDWRVERLRLALGIEAAQQPASDPGFEPGHWYLSANAWFSFRCDEIVQGRALGVQYIHKGDLNGQKVPAWYASREEGCWNEIVAPKERS